MKVIDMKWGNPDFLAPYWSSQSLNIVNVLKDLGYQRTTGHKALKVAIAQLHTLVHGYDMSKYEVIVGTGATQLLVASIKALGAPAGAVAPYYPRLPLLTDLAGVKWDITKGFTHIRTIPSNPMGDVTPILPMCGHTIHDLSYNWPIYTDKLYTKERNIMVYSFSKAFGYASTRIGWLLVNKTKITEKTIKKIKDYIEHSTNDVSLASQNLALNVIHHTLKRIKQMNPTVFDYGKDVLDKRWAEVWNIQLKDSKVLNRMGMFLYMEGETPPFVETLEGNMCGDSNKRYRINLGCSEATWKAFLERVQHGI